MVRRHEDGGFSGGPECLHGVIPRQPVKPLGILLFSAADFAGGWGILPQSVWVASRRPCPWIGYVM